MGVIDVAHQMGMGVIRRQLSGVLFKSGGKTEQQIIPQANQAVPICPIAEFFHRI